MTIKFYRYRLTHLEEPDRVVVQEHLDYCADCTADIIDLVTFKCELDSEHPPRA